MRASQQPERFLCVVPLVGNQAAATARWLPQSIESFRRCPAAEDAQGHSILGSGIAKYDLEYSAINIKPVRS